MENNVTHLDLEKLKNEINEKQSNLRHEQGDRIGESFFKFQESMEKKLDKVIESMELLRKEIKQEYSQKWVEDAMKGLIGIVLIAVVGALIATVIK